MCAILGLDGIFNGNLLVSALETLKHRGKDSSGIFLLSDENIIFNNNNILIPSSEDKINNIHQFAFNNNFKIGLANSLSMSNKLDNDKKFNKYNNFILSFDGEIYNLDEIKDFLEYQEEISNGEILIKTIDQFLLKNNNHFLEAIKKTINIIDGDYAFAVFDGKNLAICRDSIGVKPVYYGEKENSYFDRDNFKGFASGGADRDNFKGFASGGADRDNFKGFASGGADRDDFKGFASEKKALWRIGIKNDNIKTLKPGYILYNWKEIAPNNYPWELSHNYKSKIADMEYNNLKTCLKRLLIDSTYKRVANLDEIGLIFSGGVDSTILAVLLKKLSSKTDLKLNLYSVGHENSQDLSFSEKIANELELPLKTQIINEKVVKNSLKPTLKAIEEFNIMKIGVGMVIYLATKLAKKDGIKVSLSGQGADELFAGYNRYLSTYEKGGDLAIEKELSYDIENIHHVNLQRDAGVSMANGVELRVPFLDEKLVKFSLAIPSKYKIYSSKDKLRKHILRDLAIDLGVPDYVAIRRKKAAQYGSGIDKLLRKKVLKDFDSEKFMNDLMDNYC